jgi:glycosyltransferase involved in cell wall biosynthesis
MKPVRLLYLLPADGFGGAERQGVYHLAELPRHGFDVRAVVGPSAALMQALRDTESRCERFEHSCEATLSPESIWGRVGALGAHAAAVARAASDIERLVRDERCDLVFANRTTAWLIAAAASVRLGVPYVIRAGSRPAHPWLVLGLRALDRVSPPAAVFSNCVAVDRTIGAWFRVPRYIVANAVDLDVFSPGSPAPARARLGLPPATPLVGLAARPAPEKGFELFARVVTRVRARRPDVRFVVAGEFAWRGHIEAQLRAAGLGGSVRFLGHVHQMSDFFRAVDVVVLTSKASSIEASPNALLEAMATARPIVATDVGGVSELVSHGLEGYLMDEEDASGFADHVVRLLCWPEGRVRLGRAGRERAMGHGVSAVVATLAHDLRDVVRRLNRGAESHATVATLPMGG